MFLVMFRRSAIYFCLAAASASTRLPTSMIMECWRSCFAQIPRRLPRISSMNERISLVMVDPDLDELARERSDAASSSLGSASRAASSESCWLIKYCAWASCSPSLPPPSPPAYPYHSPSPPSSSPAGSVASYSSSSRCQPRPRSRWPPSHSYGACPTGL